jgi:hypothetical protein
MPMMLAAGGGIAITVAIVGSIPPTDGAIELVEGDDYRAADGRQFVVTVTGAPSLIGATVRLHGVAESDGSTFSVDGVILAADKVSFDIPSSTTSTLYAGDGAYKYAIRATLASGLVLTLQLGAISVLSEQ